MDSGWVKVYRSLKEKGYYKKSEFVHLWVHIMLEANHKGKEFFFNGETKKLNPGQFVTGRKKLSSDTGIQESKVERVLKCFETEQQIEQQKSNKNRVISVVNWDQYQNSEQQVEQQLNNKRTTTEQQLNTNKNVKKLKNEKKREKRFTPPTLLEVKDYIDSENLSTIDPEYWIDYYISNGWKVGKNKMQDWKRTLKNWHRREIKNSDSRPKRQTEIDLRDSSRGKYFGQ